MYENDEDNKDEKLESVTLIVDDVFINITSPEIGRQNPNDKQEGSN